MEYRGKIGYIRYILQAILLLVICYHPVFSRDMSPYIMSTFYESQGKLEDARRELILSFRKTMETELLKDITRLSIELEDFPRAVRYGEGYLVENKDRDVFLWVIDSYLRLGKVQRGVELAETALDYFPNDFDIRSLLLRLRKKKGELAEVDKGYKELISLFPESTALLIDYADFLLNHNDPDSAEKLLSPIYDTLEGNYNIEMIMARIYEEKGMWTDAVKHYAIAQEYAGGNIVPLLNMGKVYLEIEDYPNAIKVFEAAKNIDFLNQLLRELLGYSYYKEGNLQRAIEEYLIAVSLEDTNSSAHYFLSRIYFTLKDIDKARYHIEKAIEVEEKYDYMLYSAYIDLSSNEVKSALGKLLRLQDKKDAHLYSLIAYTYRELGDNKKAEDYLLKAYEIDSNSVSILRDISLLLLGENKEEETLPYLERWAELDSTSREALFELAMLYSRMGRVEEADTTFLRLAQLDSLNPVVFNNWGYVLVEHKTQLEKAKKLIEKALILSPDNPIYLDSMGWLYFMLGDLEKAKVYLKRAIELGAEDPEIYRHMGEILKNMGDKEGAMDYFRKSLRLDPHQDDLLEKIRYAE